MISKKMMIIGGSIAGAAVVTTAVVVPVVLTSSHGGSSTPSIDQEKLPKITLDNISPKSRDVSFDVNIEQNDENYVIDEITFYIKDKKNQIEAFKAIHKVEKNEFSINTESSENHETIRVLKSETEYQIYASYTLIDQPAQGIKLLEGSDFTTEATEKFGFTPAIKEKANGVEISLDITKNNDNFYNPESIFVEIFDDNGNEIIKSQKMNSSNDGQLFEYDSTIYKELNENEKYIYRISYDDNGNDYSENKPKLLIEDNFRTDDSPKPSVEVENYESNSRDITIDIKVKQPVIEGASTKLDYNISKISFRLIDENGKEVEHGKITDHVINSSEETITFDTKPGGNDDYIRRLDADSSYSLEAKWEHIDADDKEWHILKGGIMTTSEESTPTISIKDSKPIVGAKSVKIDFTLTQPTIIKRFIGRSDLYFHAEIVKVELFKNDGELIKDSVQEYSGDQLTKEINYEYNGLKAETDYKYKITYDDKGDQFDDFKGTFENGEGAFKTLDAPKPTLKVSNIKKTSRDIAADIEVKQPVYEKASDKKDYGIKTISFRLVDENNDAIEYGKIDNQTLDGQDTKIFNFDTGINSGDMQRRLESGKIYSLQTKYSYIDAEPQEWYTIEEKIITLADENKPTLSPVKFDEEKTSVKMSTSITNNATDEFYNANEIKVEIFDISDSFIKSEIFNENQFNSIEWVIDGLTIGTKYKYKISYNDKGSDYNEFNGTFDQNGSGEFETLSRDPVSSIESFTITSRDLEAKVKVSQPNEGPKIENVSLKLIDSNGNDVDAGKMNDIAFTEETTQIFDFNTVPDTGDDYIRRLESNSKYSLILTCEFSDGSTHKEKVGEDFITNESEEIEVVDSLFRYAGWHPDDPDYGGDFGGFGFQLIFKPTIDNFYNIQETPKYNDGNVILRFYNEDKELLTFFKPEIEDADDENNKIDILTTMTDHWDSDGNPMGKFEVNIYDKFYLEVWYNDFMITILLMHI